MGNEGLFIRAGKNQDGGVHHGCATGGIHVTGVTCRSQSSHLHLLRLSVNNVIACY